MRHLKLLLTASAAISLAAAGVATAESAHTSGATTVITTKSTSLGTILASSGKTLYTAPSCTGGCQSIWPPLKAKGKLKAAGKARASDLGMKHGQVTYNGHLLYTFSSDATGTSGEGTAGFYVVSPNGSLIKHAPRSTGSSSTGGGW